MYSALLERNYGDKQTIGKMHCMDGDFVQISFDSLELPWEDNENNISCIPEGEYEVVTRYSQKYGKHYHVTDVEGRSWILIHAGNFYTSIRCC